MVSLRTPPRGKQPATPPEIDGQHQTMQTLAMPGFGKPQTHCAREISEHSVFVGWTRWAMTLRADTRTTRGIILSADVQRGWPVGRGLAYSDLKIKLTIAHVPHQRLLERLGSKIHWYARHAIAKKDCGRRAESRAGRHPDLIELCRPTSRMLLHRPS